MNRKAQREALAAAQQNGTMDTEATRRSLRKIQMAEDLETGNPPPPDADGEVGVNGYATCELAVATLEADRTRRVKEWGERFAALCEELRIHPVYEEVYRNGQLVELKIVPVADP